MSVAGGTAPKRSSRRRAGGRPANGYQRDRNIGFLLRKAYQKNMMLFQRLCLDSQLTSVQLAALHVLTETGPCSLTELGRRAAMDPATTSGVVDRLKDRALVALAPDPSDRRKVIVHLEPAGQQIVTDMLPVLVEVADLTLDRLAPHERTTLIDLLYKVTSAEP